jgi:hypothetical protein
LVIVGSAPGDADLSGPVVLSPGQPVAFTFPPEARRAYVSAWLTDAPGTFAYSLTFWRAAADLAAETVVRRLLGSYWLEGWMGPSLDERRLCPARVLGFAGEEVSFSAESVDDVAPWTPAEVRSSVGYALLRLRELDRFDDGLSAGVERIEGAERVVSREYRLYALDFDFALPSKPAGGVDPVTAIEQRRAEVENLFEGLALLPEGTPVLSIRQLARYPTRRRGGFDDGTWRRAYLTVQVRARVRKIHSGPQEVALP